ncbi:hypothetical protein RYX36_017530 [Vicia faba]
MRGQTEYSPKGVAKLAAVPVAALCVQDEADLRPNISIVKALQILEKASAPAPQIFAQRIIESIGFVFGMLGGYSSDKGYRNATKESEG